MIYEETASLCLRGEIFRLNLGIFDLDYGSNPWYRLSKASIQEYKSRILLPLENQPSVYYQTLSAFALRR